MSKWNGSGGFRPGKSGDSRNSTSFGELPPLLTFPGASADVACVQALIINHHAERGSNRLFKLGDTNDMAKQLEVIKI